MLRMVPPRHELATRKTSLMGQPRRARSCQEVIGVDMLDDCALTVLGVELGMSYNFSLVRYLYALTRSY